jgi:hypothetical protein
MDQNPAPDPTPDQTTFFTNFKDAKKNSYFFLITCPQAHHLQNKKLNFFLKFWLKFYFSFMRKRNDPEPDPPVPRGQNTCGSYESASGSGSPTLLSPQRRRCRTSQLQDYRVPYKSTDYPLPPLLNVNVTYCVRVSLWTVKIFLAHH